LAKAAPGHPVSGHGHSIPDVAGDAGRFWLSGSTYERSSLDALDAQAGLEANSLRISALLEPGAPRAAALIQDQFASNEVGNWAGQRCTSRDRFPLAGACSADWPGLCMSTAMGSRGLSFAALCADLVAAQLHGEPMPLEIGLAKAFSPQRFLQKAALAGFQLA
jgi:tRNA 5-methylaminomethyl-2-thiouridine biosynthesis bifunctional protein